MDKDPSITAVTVTNESSIIVDVIVANFTAGQADPIVTLGGMVMTVDAGTLMDTFVSASLPGAFEPSDYLLTVTHSKGVGQYNLTVGAVGPQGDAGLPGADGADGADGAPGTHGAQGPQGELGPAFVATNTNFFLQTQGPGQTTTFTGYLGSNSICAISRIDVFDVALFGTKCQAILLGDQWAGYVEGRVFCNITCFRFQ